MPKIGDTVAFKNGNNQNKTCIISDIAYNPEHRMTYHYVDGKTRETMHGWSADTFDVVSKKVEDFRTSNPRLHSQYVDNAKRVLSVIETALRDLDEMSLVDASIIAGTLRKERAALVANNAAYMDAAAILYVGEDWLKEAE